MIQWVAAAGVLLYAMGRKKTSNGGEKFTFGVMQLVQGRSYRFEAEANVSGLQEHPSNFARGLVAGMHASGAWDVYVSPSIPMQVSYSGKAQETSALSVGSPIPYDVGGYQGSWLVRSVQELPSSAGPAQLTRG